MRAYPKNKPDYRTHGVLYGIPYPIGCHPAQQTGDIAVWKRKVGGGTTGDHVMSWVELGGVAENTGIADLYQIHWASPLGGCVEYTHPSLDPVTGLVPRLWKAAVDDSGVFEVAKVVMSCPETATSKLDPSLTGYYVQWANYERSFSEISLAECADCQDVIDDYWSSKNSRS